MVSVRPDESGEPVNQHAIQVRDPLDRERRLRFIRVRSRAQKVTTSPLFATDPSAGLAMLTTGGRPTMNTMSSTHTAPTSSDTVMLIVWVAMLSAEDEMVTKALGVRCAIAEGAIDVAAPAHRERLRADVRVIHRALECTGQPLPSSGTRGR